MVDVCRQNARAASDTSIPVASTQCKAGLKSVAAASSDGAGGATASVELLEDRSVLVRLGASGVCIDSATTSEQPAESTNYDSVNSLLLNTSPKFVQHFNSSLASALASAGSYEPRWADVDDNDH